MVHRAELVTRKDATAEGAIPPHRRLSSLWFPLGDREGVWRRSGGVMATCCLNNRRPLGLCACVHAGRGSRVKKACSLWGIDFYLWHDVTFPSVTPVVVCVRRGISAKRKWTFPLFHPRERESRQSWDIVCLSSSWQICSSLRLQPDTNLNVSMDWLMLMQK